MMGIIDSFGSILALIITALLAAVAVMGKMLSSQKQKTRRVQEQADALQEHTSRRAKIDAVDQVVEQAGVVREEEVRKETSAGRRDHFENTQ